MSSILPIPVNVVERTAPDPETDARIARRNKPDQVFGELSIRDIEPSQVEKYNLKPGMITPFTRLRITV